LLGVSASEPAISIATLAPETNWFTIPCNNCVAYNKYKQVEIKDFEASCSITPYLAKTKRLYKYNLDFKILH
jgi:hypothetical protein